LRAKFDIVINSLSAANLAYLKTLCTRHNNVIRVVVCILWTMWSAVCYQARYGCALASSDDWRPFQFEV